ncbi:MAG: hypothetical protein HY720_03895 [Planctomycetes bacterium]|nr:hypothetical protein [Planctomycetota bacterium]
MSERTSLPVYHGLREILLRYDRKSAVAILSLVASQVAVGLSYRDLVGEHAWMWEDHLLLFSWGLMTLLLSWDIRPRRDLLLAIVGFGGGLVIEWWGTTTELWIYFTEERPPIWILPAWPAAALAIDRLGRLATAIRPIESHAWTAYWTLLPLFVSAMTAFLWPSFRIPSSWVVLALMLSTLFWRPLHHRDVCLFLGGSALGILLETWGTTRGCWTYYTGETPPWIAVAAHGFASVAFSRGVQLLDIALDLGFRGLAGPAVKSR